MNYIIVDLEMNPVAKQFKEERTISRMEIIEIGAVIMDENFLVLGEFKTLVKPQFNDEIYKKYEPLTGISTNMVSTAPAFSTAYEMFVNWCESYGKEYEVYAWSENDYNQLVAEMTQKNYSNENMKKPLKHWNDFQKEYSEKLGLERIMSLENALYCAGMDFEGRQHDALCDAKNTAKLFALVHDETKCEKMLKSVLDVFKAKHITGTLGEMFDFGAMMAQLT